MLAVLLQDFEQHADEALWETGAGGHLNHALAAPGRAARRDRRRRRASRSRCWHCSSGAPIAGREALQRALDAGHPFREQRLPVRHGDGVRHLVLQRQARCSTRQGRTLGWRGVIADVTDKVASEQRLRQLAHTDSLTGLANRLTLRDALAGCAARRSSRGALLMVDLDHFKVVNDTPRPQRRRRAAQVRGAAPARQPARRRPGGAPGRRRVRGADDASGAPHEAADRWRSA